MGAEILIGLAVAFVVLGPERMHSMLGHLGRAKAQLERVTLETRNQPSGGSSANYNRENYDRPSGKES